MAEIINLRTVRKRKARADQAVQADQNRLTFGRTKAERTLSEAKGALADKALDGHKRDGE